MKTVFAFWRTSCPFALLLSICPWAWGMLHVSLDRSQRRRTTGKKPDQGRRTVASQHQCKSLGFPVSYSMWNFEKSRDKEKHRIGIEKQTHHFFRGHVLGSGRVGAFSSGGRHAFGGPPAGPGPPHRSASAPQPPPKGWSGTSFFYRSEGYTLPKMCRNSTRK